jgi:hypothetical protein
MIAFRPDRKTGPGVLTVLPGGKDATARPYTLADLDESRDDALGCALCAGVIEPGAPMTYRIAGEGGFLFFHPDCGLVPTASCDETSAPYARTREPGDRSA